MEWTGKRVVVIGAARQGTVLARYLAGQGAWVVINDQRREDQLQPALQALAGLDVEWALGGHPLEILDGADLVCPSGGVPLELPIIQAALQRGIPLSNDSQVFLESAPCKVIGITGSAGKTTTTTLVGRIAETARGAAGPGSVRGRVWVGGNIGNPLLDNIEAMQADDLAVMELSSFQLAVMCASPQVAVVLNITPNHLDRHGTMEAYTAAKRRILEYQTQDDAAVLGCEDPGAWGLLTEVRAKQVWTFGSCQGAGRRYPGTFAREGAAWLWDGQQERELFALDRIDLRGEHNRSNVLAACAAAAAAGLSLESAGQGIQGFKGVAHRLEFVRQWGGAAWYNDSIATAPERAMAAIQAFEEPVILLAGGRDKNLPWEGFASLVRQRVDHLVLFGEAAGKIAQALNHAEAGSRPYSLHLCAGLQEAVRTAAGLVRPGTVVLLSPGGTSFDEFRDFESRGDEFRKWVCAL